MQSFIMNSHEVFIYIHQGCFAGIGAIVRLPQCQWSKPDGYGKISQCITTTKHSKAKTVCIFLGIYCNFTLWKRKWPNLHQTQYRRLTYDLLLQANVYHSDSLELIQALFINYLPKMINQMPIWMASKYLHLFRYSSGSDTDTNISGYLGQQI